MSGPGGLPERVANNGRCKHCHACCREAVPPGRLHYWGKAKDSHGPSSVPPFSIVCCSPVWSINRLQLYITLPPPPILRRLGDGTGLLIALGVAVSERRGWACQDTNAGENEAATTALLLAYFLDRQTSFAILPEQTMPTSRQMLLLFLQLRPLVCGQFPWWPCCAAS